MVLSRTDRQQQTQQGRTVSTPETNPIYNPKQWWQYPLDWIRNVERGAGTILTAPFTPSVPGTENLPWFQREQAEYEAWQEPSFQVNPLFRLPWTPEEIRNRPWTIGVKGAVEQVPWFATTLLTAGLGGVGWLGGKAAASNLPKLAAGLRAVNVVGRTAIEPIVAAERLAALPLRPVEKLAGKAVGAIATKASEKGIEIPDSVLKMTNILKTAKTAVRETKALRHEELSKRVAKASAILESNEGEAAFRKSLRALGGEQPKAQLEPLRPMLKEEIPELVNMINNANQDYFTKVTAYRGFQKLMVGDIPQRNEIAKMEKIFGKDFAKALLSKRETSQKVAEAVMSAANLPRAVLASFDLSGLLRQGGILASRHPIEAFRTVKPMLKAFFKEKNAQLMDEIIRTRPHFALSQEYKLYHAPLPGKATILTEREENFMSQFAELIPGVKQSERAYITVLNDLRSRMWESTLSTWEKTGVKLVENDYEQLARLINFASGRGDIEILSKLGLSKRAARGLAPALNATMFSPRLLFSRMQLPTMLFSSSKEVRKEAWRTMVQFLGIGTSVLSLLKLGGAEVNLDPRSADFGKAKIGNTRLDIWTGYSQYARFLAQFATAQRKTQSGNISEMTRREVVERFLQSKSSPVFGLLLDLLKGETYMGDELALDTESLTKQVYQRLTPLFIQDMADAVYQDGLTGGFAAFPSVFGVGVVTYVDEVDKMRNDLAQEKYGDIGIMSWDQLGQELGRAAQLELERSSPELQQKMDERYKKWVGSTEAEYYQQGRLIEKAFQDSVNQAAQQARATSDFTKFKDNYDRAAYMRRMMYAARDADERFAFVVEQRNKPLTEAEIRQMNPQDLAARQYYDMLYSDDMYDELGFYNFDEADRRKAQFRQQFGQAAVDYVESLSGLRWDEPEEVKLLRQARQVLQPYWEITDQVWSQYPPQLKQIADEIEIIERQDPDQGKRLLMQYPMIVFIRRQIALYKKQLKMFNPQIAQALRTFYTY